MTGRRTHACWTEDPQRVWSALGWQLIVRGDELADITFDGSPVLRAVRFVPRDAEWRTPVTSVEVSASSDRALRMSMRSRLDGLDVSSTLTAVASENALEVQLGAQTNAEFSANRLGLVAQQPPSLAGTPLHVHHADGTSSTVTLPHRISPHQPARDISALGWVADGVDIGVVFTGATFEIEDQRNWTDASFKAYSPPLDEPFPRVFSAGHRVEQSITLTAQRIGAPVRKHDADLRLTLASSGGVMPDVGLGAATAPEPVVRVAADACFILVELELDQPNWQEALERASRSGLPLDVRLVTDHAERIPPALDAVNGRSARRVGVYSASSHVSEPELWDALRSHSLAANWELVGGTRAHFTELNRTHERLPHFDSYAFSLTPQMHVREGAQLVESIPMQYLAARQAAEIAQGAPVHVGPVTLRPRFNAVATTPQPPEPAGISLGYGAEFVPDATDSRQADRELAAWVISSIASLVAAGHIASISYFEEWGSRGAVSEEGVGLPAGDAISSMAALAGRSLLVQEPPETGQRVHAFGTFADGVSTVFVTNLADTERTVTVELGEHEAAVRLGPFEYRELTL